MNTYWLVMKWDYQYDKESTWFDEESGVERYALESGAAYALPHIKEKRLEIRSVTQDGDTVKAELYADHHVFTVCSDEQPVTAHASYQYSVCGDSVSQSLCLTFTIEKN